MDPTRKTKRWRILLRDHPVAAAGFCLLAALGVWLLWGKYAAEPSTVYASIENSMRIVDQSGPLGYSIAAKLDDGTDIVVTADLNGRAPVAGERIRLKRSRTPKGLVHYVWIR